MGLRDKSSQAINSTGDDHHSQQPRENKSVVFLAGSARSHLPMSEIYLHNWGIDYSAETAADWLYAMGRYTLLSGSRLPGRCSRLQWQKYVDKRT